MRLGQEKAQKLARVGWEGERHLLEAVLLPPVYRLAFIHVQVINVCSNERYLIEG